MAWIVLFIFGIILSPKQSGNKNNKIKNSIHVIFTILHKHFHVRRVLQSEKQFILE